MTNATKETLKDETKPWRKRLSDKKSIRLVVDIPSATKEKMDIFKAKTRHTIEKVVRDSIEFYIFAKNAQEEEKKKGIKK